MPTRYKEADLTFVALPLPALPGSLAILICPLAVLPLPPVFLACRSIMTILTCSLTIFPGLLVLEILLCPMKVLPSPLRGDAVTQIATNIGDTYLMQAR